MSSALTTQPVPRSLPARELVSPYQKNLVGLARASSKAVGSTKRNWLLLAACAVFLSLLTVYIQEQKLGLEYIEQRQQITRHQNVLDGIAGNPWQYRIFSVCVADILIRLATFLHIPHPVAVGFLSLRVIQNALLFVVAAAYYRKLGLSFGACLIGVNILAWGVTHALYDSDLSFNIYFDILFYLLAGLSILYHKPLAILPITVVAALNRETSGFIPFLLLAHHYFCTPAVDRKSGTAWIGIVSLAAYTAIFFGLRTLFGPQSLVTCYDHKLGLDVLWYNVSRLVTWHQLAATCAFIPVIAVWAIRKWPSTLRVFFWTAVPLWLAVHFVACIVAESRVVLVPFALVFVPGALFGCLAASSHPKEPAPARQ